MLLDSGHQVLAEDLAPLQQARRRKLGDRTASLCRKSQGLSPGARPTQSPSPHLQSQMRPTARRLTPMLKPGSIPGRNPRPGTLTVVQQRLNGELVIGPFDAILESGDEALLAEVVGAGVHGFDLAHVALLKASVGRGCRGQKAGARGNTDFKGRARPRLPAHLRIMSWTPCLTLAKVTVSERL